MVSNVDKRKVFVYFSLGSNLGDKKMILERGISLISQKIGECVKRSSVYVTEPWGEKKLHAFYNMVIKVETSLQPLIILDLTQQIEKKMGRDEKKKEGYENRVLDIDLLFYDREIIRLDTLKVPHPLLHLRNFVLHPLAEIEPELEHPALNKSVLSLLNRCIDKNEIEKLD